MFCLFFVYSSQNINYSTFFPSNFLKVSWCKHISAILININYASVFYFPLKSLFKCVLVLAFACGLQYDKATGACVTNGKAGHLLFYKCPSDTQLYNVRTECLRRKFMIDITRLFLPPLNFNNILFNEVVFKKAVDGIYGERYRQGLGSNPTPANLWKKHFTASSAWQPHS